MIRTLLSALPFVSAALFPWPLTAILAVAASFVEPLVPLAVGIFADTLHYSPLSGHPPILTLAGGALTLIAYFVRSRLRAGIM